MVAARTAPERRRSHEDSTEPADAGEDNPGAAREPQDPHPDGLPSPRARVGRRVEPCQFRDDVEVVIERVADFDPLSVGVGRERRVDER